MKTDPVGLLIASSSIGPRSGRATGQTGRQALRSSALGLSALLVTLGLSARATTITFATNPLPANNSDLPANFASNATGDFPGWITSDGTGPTPNIALLWAPAGAAPNNDVLEFHSSTTFSGAGFTIPILQLDVDLSGHSVLPPDPTVDFLVSGGFSLKLHSLEIGNATDQTEAPYRWLINVIRLSDMQTMDTKTTSFMSAGNRETVTFDFTGAPGESYRLLFDDEGANRVRTGIDNLSFSQIPEPGVLALFALGGMGLVARAMRRTA